MNEKLNKRLNLIIDVSAKEMSSSTSEVLLSRFLDLFRLRLQDPYFGEIYDKLKTLTVKLGMDYPKTAGVLKSLVTDFQNNEKAGFELITEFGINLSEECTDREKEILQEDVTTDKVLGFFDLTKLKSSS